MDSKTIPQSPAAPRPAQRADSQVTTDCVISMGHDPENQPTAFICFDEQHSEYGQSIARWADVGPDLLAALKMVEAALAEDEHDTLFSISIRAAIRAAEGGAK